MYLHATSFYLDMITENEPILTKYVSIPKELHGLNVSALVAGILESFIVNAGFGCSVSALSAPTSKYPNKTVYLIKFTN